MQTILGHVRQSYSLDNTTDRWLVVGDYHVVVSSHRSLADAESAYAGIGKAGPDGLAETRFAVLAIVPPGHPISGELMTPIMGDDGQSADDVYASFFGGP